MSGFSNSIEAAILNHFFSKSTWTAPADIFVALSTTAPADDGTNVTEPSGGGYARVDTAPADWNTASGTAPTQVTNANVITFPAATASWGTVTHFALYTAASAGTFIGSGALAAGVAVDNGDTASFAAGALAMKLGDTGDTY